jgi:5'-3' exonuclease
VDTLLLDAPTLVYRAFFALPTSLTDASGRPVNAVRGFMDMVARLLTDFRPARAVAVFDADWRPAWRVEIYPGYKSERPEDPPELPPQFDVIADVLDAAGIERAEAKGYEADDVLATLVARKSSDDVVGIVTGDRDLVALVRDPDVKLLWLGRGIRRLQAMDEEHVRAAYGVPPALYPQLAILRGDPSDGLPGVAGIGPARAAGLLLEHGSIQGILDRVDDLPPRQRAALDGARDYLAAMQRIVPLVDDVDVEATRPEPFQAERLVQLAAAHGLGGAATRLAQARSLEPEGPA